MKNRRPAAAWDHLRVLDGKSDVLVVLPFSLTNGILDAVNSFEAISRMEAVELILSTLCYLTKGNKTLMLHRIKKPNDVHQGKWVGLGGKAEENESPDECMLREVREEAGIQITDYQLRGIITFPEFTPGHTWHVFVYMAHDFIGEISDCNEGVLEWVSNDSITTLDLWESDRVFLDWLYNGDGFFTAKFRDTKTDHFTHTVRFL